MPEWITPLLWPVWWRPTSASFSTTTSPQPGKASCNDSAVARPTIPPPITQKSYMDRGPLAGSSRCALDGIDQPPVEGGDGVDRGAGQSQQGGAVTADAP